MRKTWRIKLQFDGDTKPKVYRTNGQPTCCCSLQIDYFTWEKNTKYNDYNGWSGYISAAMVKSSLEKYNPDGLKLS